MLVPYCTFFLREGELGSCGRVCLAPWCWSASHARGEVCTVDTSVAFRAGGHTWKLDITFTSPLYLAVRVRCLGVLFMAQCLVQQWVHAMRQLLVFLEGFLCEGELVS